MISFSIFSFSFLTKLFIFNTIHKKEEVYTKGKENENQEMFICIKFKDEKILVINQQNDI